MKLIGLHGAGSDGATFDGRYMVSKHAEEFGYEAFTPDSKREAWSAEDDDMLLGIIGDEPCRLWGLSSGGFAAARFALKYTHLVDKVCCMSSGLVSEDAYLVRETFPEDMPAFMFVTPENDSAVWTNGGIFLDGRSYLGSLDSLKLITGQETYDQGPERIDMIDPQGEGLLYEWMFSRAMSGAETSVSWWQGGHELRMIRNANHLFYLGPHGCRNLLEWITGPL